MKISITQKDHRHYDGGDYFVNGIRCQNVEDGWQITTTNNKTGKIKDYWFARGLIFTVAGSISLDFPSSKLICPGARAKNLADKEEKAIRNALASWGVEVPA